MPLEKLQEKLSSLKRAIKIELADDLVQKERINICQSCEHLFPVTSQCKKCGCFVHAKTKLAKATCPLAKW